jgi:hypothetical protein
MNLDPVLQECYHTDIVTWHDSVEDVMFSFHIRPVDGGIGEVDELLVQQNVPTIVNNHYIAI